MKRCSLEKHIRLEFEATHKKRARWWNLTLLGEYVLKHILKATTELKPNVLLLDVSISYFSFPATTDFHA